MTEATQHPMTLEILTGLVPLHILRLMHHPGELTRAQCESGELADTIAEYGDRLTNPGSFSDRGHRAERSRLLNAIATGLALGALKPGGITWAGLHWCTETHTACPNRSS